MKPTRRDFIKGGVSAFTLSFAAPAFISDLAIAQGANARNLIILYLSGGNFASRLPATLTVMLPILVLDVLLAPQLGKAEVLGLLQKMTTGQHLTDPSTDTHHRTGSCSGRAGQWHLHGKDGHLLNTGW